jgi:hypothetical protein
MLIAVLRLILFGLGMLAIGWALAMWFISAGRDALGALILLVAGGGACALAIALRVSRGAGPAEPDDIRKLPGARHRELIRGTSLFLRDSNFRYSVRSDSRVGAADRAFNADVNTVRLGFLPAAITDNTNDREGYGYVALVYDGHRWCGPGLPCPADQTQAVRHAARCVSPLASEEETRFEGVS